MEKSVVPFFWDAIWNCGLVITRKLFCFILRNVQKKGPRSIALSFPGRVHEFSCISFDARTARASPKNKRGIDSAQARNHLNCVAYRIPSLEIPVCETRFAWKFGCPSHSFSFKGFVIDLAWPPALLCSEEMI